METLGDGEAQGSLECCSPWGHREPDLTDRLNKSRNNNGKEELSTSLTLHGKKKKHNMMRVCVHVSLCVCVYSDVIAHKF